MKKADEVVRAVADKDVTLTLIGETGTGKEVLARRAHDLSSRRQGPFVPVNCAAIPDTLFESELFGHERGAFTGANERVKGKVDAAEHGTLFLDEIGELPLGMQAKLLRFLENRRFMRVGGATKLQADVRLMFATLRPLADEVEAGRFRADLYYRIQGITVFVPPLRERPSDISLLVNHFIQNLSALHGVTPPRLSREIRAMFMRHAWPGNVRELRNVVESLCLLRGGRQVRIEDLPASFHERPSALRRSAPKERVAADRSPSAYLAQSGGLDEIVRQVVQEALRAERGHKARAAERLGISLRTIQRYISKGRVEAPH
jgi:transcriptional regulator with PAS, ATPase and Fis domain